MGILPTPTPRPTTPNYANTTTPRLPPGTGLKRLSWAKMQARRDKGLCYNCNERFIQGHKCKIQQAFLLETLQEPEEETIRWRLRTWEK